MASRRLATTMDIAVGPHPYRNLLYTGITRAKKRVVLIGQKQVLFMAIHRNEIVKRNTLLGARIGMYYKAYAKRAGITVPAAPEELKYAG